MDLWMERNIFMENKRAIMVPAVFEKNEDDVWPRSQSLLHHFHYIASGFASVVASEDLRLATHAIKISATDIISIVNYVDKIRKLKKSEWVLFMVFSVITSFLWITHAIFCLPTNKNGDALLI